MRAGAGDDAAGSSISADVVAAILKNAGASVECELRGASMGSTIPDGSRIRIEFGHAQAVDVGDVVAFVASSRTIVHRVVGRGGVGTSRSFLLTRGDGALLIDHPVHVDTVLGIVREWKDGETWEVVAPLVVTGWRGAVRQWMVLPVILALRVSHRLAMCLTVLAFSAQRLWQRLWPRVTP